MSEKPSFSGAVAENYEKYFSPMFFTVPAKDLVSRLPDETGNILELACGTGQVTRVIQDKFPDAKITATDLFSEMIESAKESFEKSEKIEWKVMDAQEISFDDNSFDAVVCQFGVMFFPDKHKAIDEAYRVLKPGGILLFNTWDRIEEQPIAEITRDIVNTFFKSDPPTFFNVPFSMNDTSVLENLLKTAGFKDISVGNVRLEGHTESAKSAAKGFILGNPMHNAIRERDENLIPHILKAVEEKFTEKFGAGEFTVPLSLFVASGVK